MHYELLSSVLCTNTKGNINNLFFSRSCAAAIISHQSSSPSSFGLSVERTVLVEYMIHRLERPTKAEFCKYVKKTWLFRTDR